MALRVDGVIVRESVIRDLRRDLRFAGRPATRAAAERRAIDDTLVAEQARRLGVEVPAAVLERIYRQALAQAGVASALRSHDISLRHFRDRLRRQLLVKRLILRQFAGLHASEAQLRARYKRDHHKFFVPLGVRLDVIQVRSFLQGKTVLRLLHEGRPWRVLVSQFSLNRGGGPDGDIGWGAPSLLPGRTGRVLARLRVGEVAPTPLRLGASYAVMKVTDRRPAHYDTFGEVRRAIQITMSSELRQAAFDRWLAGQRSAAHVVRER